MSRLFGCLVSMWTAVAGAGCVFNALQGAPCSVSSECTDSVCVALDPDDVEDGVNAICVPHTRLSERLCTEDSECTAEEGWPVDATCNAGSCSCVDVADNCAIGGLDVNTCACEEGL